MSQIDQEQTIETVLTNLEPALLLSALHASMGRPDPEGPSALTEIGHRLHKAGVNCGPDACRSGFVQRQVMNYAGNQVVRQLHQSLHQN